MNPIQRTMLTVSVFVLSFFLCWGGAHGMEKPEIVRLDAHYTANVVKISVHWQSANPVSVVQAIVGGEAHEIRIDPYDNRRNPDGYSGEAEKSGLILTTTGGTRTVTRVRPRSW